MQALKAGVALETVRRPIEYTKVKVPVRVHSTGGAESKVKEEAKSSLDCMF